MDAPLSRLLWICLGGGAGTGARWLLSTWTARTFGTEFPLGTLVVNVVGSFLLGVITAASMPTDAASETLRLTLAVGVLGGFTTYSTFNQETIEYARQGAWGLALANVGITLVACAAAGLLGLFVGHRLAAS
jgi:CrcB protein